MRRTLTGYGIAVVIVLAALNGITSHSPDEAAILSAAASI
jgi:hypothetical protein